MTPAPLQDRPAGELTSIAQILADDWGRSMWAAVALGALTNGAHERPFIVDWPALARWRDRVLRDPGRHTPDVVAAALEALALESLLSGHPELADRAIAEAERAVLGANATRTPHGAEVG